MKYLTTILIKYLKRIKKIILTKSLAASTKERGELELKNKLTSIIPDLSDQYSTWKLDMDDTFLVEKIRSQHTFQINSVLKAIQFLDDKKIINIVDVGDSSGTHLTYLKYLLSDSSININALSVNLDETAISKIKQKGIEALLCRAEDLQKHDIHADIFLSFEMLEHLFDPISFLHSISENSNCKFLIITVPYLQKSRIGLRQVMNNSRDEFFAENTHIFELCPSDWDMVFKFSGWKIIYSDKYTQYPKSGLLNLTKHEWRRIDFDGFYGVILKIDDSFSKKYKSW